MSPGDRTCSLWSSITNASHITPREHSLRAARNNMLGSGFAALPHPRASWGGGDHSHAVGATGDLGKPWGEQCLLLSTSLLYAVSRAVSSRSHQVSADQKRRTPSKRKPPQNRAQPPSAVSLLSSSPTEIFFPFPLGCSFVPTSAEGTWGQPRRGRVARGDISCRTCSPGKTRRLRGLATGRRKRFVGGCVSGESKMPAC